MSSRASTAAKRKQNRATRHAAHRQVSQEVVQAFDEAADQTHRETWESKSVVVQGFEIPQKMAKKLTDDAIWILGHVKRRGAAYFETDDGAEDMNTVTQLGLIAEYGGYFDIMHSPDEHQHWIIERDHFRVRLGH